MKCLKCGKDNPIDAKFCNSCGEKLPEQSIEGIWNDVQNQARESSSIFKDSSEQEYLNEKITTRTKLVLNKNKTICTVVGIVCVVIVLVVIIGLLFNNRRESSDYVTTSATDITEMTDHNKKESLQLNQLNYSSRFHDIEFKTSSEWEFDDVNDNNHCYYIDGTSFYLDVQRQEMEQNEADEIISGIIENKDENYISVNEDKVDGANGVVYTAMITDDTTARTTAFYVNESLYLFSLVCDKDYEDEMISAFPFVRSKISIVDSTTATTVAPTEIPTEPPTERSTETPTEAPTVAQIDNPTSTGGWSAQGSGDYVAEGLKVEGYAVLTINYYGEGNFSVVSYENGDDYDDLLVNEIGNYSGQVLIDRGGTFDLEITADGEWTIQTSGLSIDDSTVFSGNGDFVTGITTHDGGNWEIANDGDSNFTVIQYGVKSGYMDLLVNEIGSYSGTVKCQKADGDNIFFAIKSNGNWTLKRK